MYDRAFSRRVSDHVHGVATLPLPTNHRIRLMTAVGDEVDYGVEAGSGGGYISGSGAPLADFVAATDATPTVSLLDVGITVVNWPRAETLVGAELWADISGVPTRIQLGTFPSPLVVDAGDSVILGTADLASTLQ